MKPFEERYTAWLDGELSAADTAAFERELAADGESPATRISFQKFLADFRAHHTPPPLDSPDFFNHGILEKITGKDTLPPRSRNPWSLPRLAWFGGLSMATALVLFIAIIPKKSETHSQSAYIAQVISARSADPNISATAFQTHPAQTDDITVVWLDGLDYLPAVPENNAPADAH